MDLNKSKIRLKSQEEIDKKLQEFSGREHLYSIALFDILGFSNFVQKNGTDTIMELYTKLLDLINRRASSYDNVGDFEVSVAPVPFFENSPPNVLFHPALNPRIWINPSRIVNITPPPNSRMIKI